MKLGFGCHLVPCVPGCTRCLYDFVSDPVYREIWNLYVLTFADRVWGMLPHCQHVSVSMSGSVQHSNPDRYRKELSPLYPAAAAAPELLFKAMSHKIGCKMKHLLWIYVMTITTILRKCVWRYLFFVERWFKSEKRENERRLNPFFNAFIVFIILRISLGQRRVFNSFKKHILQESCGFSTRV